MLKMSLPACQQRALDRMEGALRASEPHLTSMYAVFARLNAGALLGGGARSAAACEASYSVGGVSPLTSRPSCMVSAKTVARNAVRKKISGTARLACASAGQAARFTALTGNEQALPPAARAYAAAAGPPGMC